VSQSPAKGVDLLKPDAAMTSPQVTAFELRWERSRNDWALILKQGRFLLFEPRRANLDFLKVKLQTEAHWGRVMVEDNLTRIA
jgi:hypothetical protein